MRASRPQKGMSTTAFDPNKHPRDIGGRFAAKGYSEADGSVSLDGDYGAQLSAGADAIADGRADTYTGRIECFEHPCLDGECDMTIERSGDRIHFSMRNEGYDSDGDRVEATIDGGSLPGNASAEQIQAHAEKIARARIDMDDDDVWAHGGDLELKYDSIQNRHVPAEGYEPFANATLEYDMGRMHAPGTVLARSHLQGGSLEEYGEAELVDNGDGSYTVAVSRAFATSEPDEEFGERNTETHVRITSIVRPESDDPEERATAARSRAREVWDQSMSGVRRGPFDEGRVYEEARENGDGETFAYTQNYTYDPENGFAAQ